MAELWREVGDRVFVRRHASLDLNVGLVGGEGGCLVVDTRCSEAEGRELAASVRTLTGAPWSVVLTHAHFDHCFGTGAFLPAAVWAHERCAAALAGSGVAERARTAELYEADGQPLVAQQVRDSTLVTPTHLVAGSAVLSIGGRRVELHHPGRGHTDHDLVVVVPDADVVFAGDLVEQGAPPQFDDAFPLDWPVALEAVAAAAGVVVPGHGDVVDRRFVTAQQDLLTELVRRSAAGRAQGAPAQVVAADLPDLGAFAVSAVERTYWQLASTGTPGPPS